MPACYICTTSILHESLLLQPRKIWAIVHKHLFCLAWHACVCIHAYVHLERKYVRKGSTEIYIHSVQRGGRGKRERERGLNPQQGIDPSASVSSLCKTEAWVLNICLVNLILSVVKPPHLHGGGHDMKAMLPVQHDLLSPLQPTAGRERT